MPDNNSRLNSSHELEPPSSFLQDLAARIKKYRHAEISRRTLEGREARLRREHQQAMAPSATTSLCWSNERKGDGPTPGIDQRQGAVALLQTPMTGKESDREERPLILSHAYSVEHQRTDAPAPSLIPAAREENDRVKQSPALPQAHSGSEWENTPEVASREGGENRTKGKIKSAHHNKEVPSQLKQLRHQENMKQS